MHKSEYYFYTEQQGGKDNSFKCGAKGILIEKAFQKNKKHNLKEGLFCNTARQVVSGDKISSEVPELSKCQLLVMGLLPRRSPRTSRTTRHEIIPEMK